ncbi:uncharacterized protein LOC135837303 [Planococcus citri]|uniref:uncharacterized protein LOC135837303 n=1 Tax=Planococcus citri TaxID=170843 RepID=UPI0031FA1346
MHSHYITKILLFSLSVLQGIFSSQAIYLENDITKLLDKWITSVFTVDSEKACDLFSTVSYYKVKEFEHELDHNVSHFDKKFFFQDVNFTMVRMTEDMVDSDFSGEWEPPQIHWKFSENKLTVFFEELMLHTQGTLGAKKNEPYADFNTYLGVFNATLVAVASPNPENTDYLKIAYDFSYPESVTFLNGDEDVQWFNVTTPPHEDLNKEIEPVLPLMISKNIQNNYEFSYALGEIFEAYTDTKKEIIYEHPDFVKNSGLFHYLIPKIPFYEFTLKRVVIFGLSNLESFKVHSTSGVFTHTLLVKNVEGSVTLDYGTDEESPLKMIFQIDCLFISKRDDTSCAYVNAQYYHIARAKTNVLLTNRQSEAIIHGLERGIASSVLPSMEVGKVCDLETPLDEIDITNATDWKSVKESYRGWIPFNDDNENSEVAKFHLNAFQS